MFTEMAKFSKKEHSQVIWNCLVKAIDISLKESNSDNLACEKTTFLVKLTQTWMEWKQGALIHDAVQIQKVN